MCVCVCVQMLKKKLPPLATDTDSKVCELPSCFGVILTATYMTKLFWHTLGGQQQ